MILMKDELFDEINQMERSSGISTFEFLNENIERKTIEIIGTNELAYIESDFFGGQGGHIGILWRDGKRAVLTDFDKSSMNKILKEIGVNRTLLKDEFEIVGLGKNRHPEDWIE